MLKPLLPETFPWLDYSRYSFSLGLDVDGRFAQLSGHSASEYDTEGGVVVRGGMQAQLETIYAKIASILEAGGCTLSDVVHLVENVALAGLPDARLVTSTRDRLLGSAKPAVNTVVVDRLLRSGALIEIEATAVRGAARLGDVSTAEGAYADASLVDNVIYLSTIHPTSDDGSVVQVADIGEQTRRVFEIASRRLRDMGLSTAHLVKTHQTVRLDAVDGLNQVDEVRREFLGPVYPASSTVLQDRVADHEDILISCDFVASTGDPQPVAQGWDRYDGLTYQPAVVAGDLLFVSAQQSIDERSGRLLYAGDVVSQARQAYENLLAVLDAAGTSVGSLFKTVEWVVPHALPDYRAAGTVRRSQLAEPWPTATGVVATALVPSQALIQVDAVAVIDR